MTIIGVIVKVGEMAGPKIGKPNPYNGMQMPIHNKAPFVTTIPNGCFMERNVQPKPNPSNPVVNGKITNSLGSITNNKQIVKRYVKTPERIDTNIANIIGTVEKGLSKYPMAGSNPPND